MKTNNNNDDMKLPEGWKDADFVITQSRYPSHDELGRLICKEDILHLMAKVVYTFEKFDVGNFISIKHCKHEL